MKMLHLVRRPKSRLLWNLGSAQWKVCQISECINHRPGCRGKSTPGPNETMCAVYHQDPAWQESDGHSR